MPKDAKETPRLGVFAIAKTDRIAVAGNDLPKGTFIINPVEYSDGELTYEDLGYIRYDWRGQLKRLDIVTGKWLQVESEQIPEGFTEKFPPPPNALEKLVGKLASSRFIKRPKAQS